MDENKKETIDELRSRQQDLLKEIEQTHRDNPKIAPASNDKPRIGTIKSPDYDEYFPANDPKWKTESPKNLDLGDAKQVGVKTPARPDVQAYDDLAFAMGTHNRDIVNAFETMSDYMLESSLRIDGILARLHRGP